MSRYIYHIYLYFPHHIFLTLKITSQNFYCNIMMFRISHIQKFTIFASNCVIREEIKKSIYSMGWVK